MSSTRHQIGIGILVALILGSLLCSCAAADWPTTWPRMRPWPKITAQPAVTPHDAAPGAASTDRARPPKSSDGVVRAVPPGEPARAATPAPAAGGCVGGNCGTQSRFRYLNIFRR